MTMMNGNIISIFVMDLLLACPKEVLQAHMCKKHNWTVKQFEEFKGYYLETLANKDFQNALNSINPGERDDPMEIEVQTDTGGKQKFKLVHGDVYISERNQAIYMWLYNPHLFKFMFRRIRPLEAIWWEAADVLRHSTAFGNIFEMPVVTAEQAKLYS